MIRCTDADDLPHKEWTCEHCQAHNSVLDADCQYCDEPPVLDGCI